MISTAESIPSSSEAGLAARDIFFEQFNDVNFYIEDEQQENVYLELVGRLFPRLRITRIFPLRGKPNLLKHAQDPINASRASRSIYILDKDFDDLLGHVVTQRNIFYLDRYSVENYILEEAAVVQIALECQPSKRRDEVQAGLQYAEYYKQTLKALEPLFRLFFAVQRFSLGLKNCDLKPEHFSIAGRHWAIDPSEVNKYEQEVYQKMRLTGVFADNRAFEGFLAKAFPNSGPRDANVSGKFLLALTFHYLKAKVPMGNVTLESLRYRLARNCSARGLRPFGSRVRAFLRESGTAA